ncbi:hypothetical protein C5167_012079 [Papaver somniferum]|uniref:Glutathione peroxidase n=1 Tax=Papaver somniferum TaxID=3469 RepID=A0A4Y7IWG6_PAPSO|nr:hypothetical protein C5167_012079 [Papaver somniferum]
MCTTSSYVISVIIINFLLRSSFFSLLQKEILFFPSLLVLFLFQNNTSPYPQIYLNLTKKSAVLLAVLYQVRVNGTTAAPVFKFLKSKSSGSLGSRVKWNFTKFLVDREGRVIGRYAPTTPPFAFEKDIQNALESKPN